MKWCIVMDMCDPHTYLHFYDVCTCTYMFVHRFFECTVHKIVISTSVLYAYECASMYTGNC